MTPHLEIPADKIRTFCDDYQIRKLSLFGSILRDDFSTDSDIDVLLEFEPEAHATYFDLIRAEKALKKIIARDRKMDLLTPGSIHNRIRDTILNSQEVIYES